MKALAASAVFLITSPLAWACGVCADDKVAATYDHAVMQRAKQAGQLVVFCELSGVIDERRVTAAAARQRGVDRASIRVSTNPAAMSFALDARRQSPEAAVAAIRKAAPEGTHVSILKVTSR